MLTSMAMRWQSSLVLMICFFSLLRANGAPWSRDALRLTGESNFVRGIAIQNLRKTPHITETLLRELRGPQKALALDAITALRLVSLVPRLLEFAVNDESGQAYLTIDSLITPENVTEVLRVYQERLFCRRSCFPAPAAAKIVMLETLGRAQVAVAADDLTRLFEENDYEVRSAVLRFVRQALLGRENKSYLEIARRAAGSRPIQIRRQAFSLLEEVRAPKRNGGRL